MNSSSVRSGICRPDGAGELGGAGGYKDFAPDGAFGGARLCPQDQSQRVDGRRRLKIFCGVGLRTCCGWALPQPRSNRNAVAAFSPALADAVGLRWVNGQNENNSKGVASVRRWIGFNAFRVDEFGERFPRVGAPRLSGADRQPWADGFESRWDSRNGDYSLNPFMAFINFIPAPQFKSSPSNSQRYKP